MVPEQVPGAYRCQDEMERDPGEKVRIPDGEWERSREQSDADEGMQNPHQNPQKSNVAL
jgi:hypothetical protein